MMIRVKCQHCNEVFPESVVHHCEQWRDKQPFNDIDEAYKAMEIKEEKTRTKLTADEQIRIEALKYARQLTLLEDSLSVLWIAKQAEYFEHYIKTGEVLK